jgi:hypothetical protein
MYELAHDRFADLKAKRDAAKTKADAAKVQLDLA